MLPDWPTGTVTILATSGEKPHAIPISTAIRAGRRTVLLALASGRESLRRLRADPDVALAVMAGDNLTVTLHGTASVLEEPLPEEVVAVAIDVAHVQDHRRPAFEVEAGVRWRWIDPEAEQRDVRVRAALERIASRGELA